MTIQSTLPLCRCGCGRYVKRPGYRFLSGAHLRNRFTTIERFWLYVDKAEGAGDCWLWAGGHTQSGPYGYGAFTLGPNTLKAHRFAYELASGEPIPDGLDALHTCDTPLCVRNDDEGVYEIGGVLLPRWGHLFRGTHADNMADMHLKERNPYRVNLETTSRGEQNGRAKLTEEDVRTIRRLRASNVGGERTPGRWTLQRLADRYGVSNHQIHMICTHRLWAHVE